MSLKTQPSRFDVLQDDVPDVVGKKNENTSKSKKKNTGSSTSKTSAKDGSSKSKKNPQTSKKSLKAMAFGGTTKHKAPSEPIVRESQSCSGTSCPIGPTKRDNPALEQQWEEWQRRDNELTVKTYESELEEALVQSKIEYQNEIAKRQEIETQSKKKIKKKGVTVPLNEFTPEVLERQSNSGGRNSLRSNEELNEDQLIQKFKEEAKLELQRNREKELLKNRQPSSRNLNLEANINEQMNNGNIEEKSLLQTLESENEDLKRDLEDYKTRLKKVQAIFQGAQELKDKAKLVYQLDNLTQINEDLNEEIRQLHSQLEQEKSKSRAAILELRKLTEQTRRRANTDEAI